jgi:hypothetical protein
MPPSPSSPTPLVDGPPGECLAATPNGLAFRLQRPDDGHPAVTGRPGNAPIGCGRVASAVSKTTRRIT